MIFGRRMKILHARGFSLVELLVATALFSIVVAVAASSFLSILNASREARSLGQLMLDIDFALEDMSRNIRTGRDFNPPLEGVGNSTSLSFFDRGGRNVTYRLDGGAILKTVAGQYVDVRMTSPEIRITRLNFARTDRRTADVDQPRIIIQVVGALQNVPESSFFLQTSVTQGELNL